MEMCHANPRPDVLEVVAPQVGHRGSLDRVHLACGECGPFASRLITSFAVYQVCEQPLGITASSPSEITRSGHV